MPSSLLISGDHQLRDDLLRLAAAAGVALDVVADAPAALRSWRSAEVVLVGADAARAVAALALQRRPGVHVVGRARLLDETFRAAYELHAENVAELPASEPWLVEILTDSVDGAAGPGTVVAVVGGSGGVGCSVFSGALAATWGETGRALLVDVDPCGAGLERVLGMERLVGTRWPDIGSVTGRLSGRSLRESLPSRRGVALLGWGSAVREGPRDPLQPFAAREVLSAGRRGHDVVVLDLPRHRDLVGDELLARADHVVLVSGASLSAVTSSGRVAARIGGLAARPHLVVRAGGALSPQEVARALALPLAAVTQHQRGLEEALDLGAGPLHARRGSVARAAREVAGRLTREAALVA